jgi:tRNA threonylcarbamoyl adenosine modification protein (Sua5/YciO/YrdC/YwlC family)
VIVSFDNPDERATGLMKARDIVASGACIVMPTDTVYGIACDAFSPAAVSTLLAIKGRGRHMPPPVLIGNVGDVEKLVAQVPDGARAIMERFWPGGVTIIFEANPDVEWDLGDTSGTVAIRMPDHPVALELLSLTGPLAVSSANRTGELPALGANEALAQFGDDVPLYVDAGRVGSLYTGASGNPGSTIVDATALATGGPWKVVRHGVCAIEDLRWVAGGEWDL